MKKKSILIKDTTKEERERIVLNALACNSGCDHCASCHHGAGDPFEMYKDYIEGRKEIAEINAEYRANYLK